MRAFLGDLDRWTVLALAAGGLLGALWLVNLAPAMAVTGLAMPLGALGFVMARRWLEAGAFIAAIGFVPTLAFRLAGPPPLRTPLPEDRIAVEVLAPGGAYFLVLFGVAVIVLAGVTQFRNGRRRERQETRHRGRRAANRLDQAP